MGDASSNKPPKILYTTTDPAAVAEIHRWYDAALERVRGRLGQNHPFYVAGQPRQGAGAFEDRSPNDTDVLVGRFASAGREDVRGAVEAAQAAHRAWAATPWQERVRLLRRVADVITEERKFELAAMLGIEVGKSRMEALGEVEEAGDLVREYCDQMERHDGYRLELKEVSPGERSVSVMRPFGVFAVIGPFNFPIALCTGMSSGALVAGNTVVFKPASDTPMAGLMLYECFAAVLPPGVFNLLTGPGGPIGEELLNSPLVDGIIFTGSRDVGMRVYRQAAAGRPRPVIAEMGGKNPVIVTARADVAAAAEGTTRSAFGFGGQKCSAASRVYVDRRVKGDFLDALRDYTSKLVVGDPTKPDTFMGPVINERAYDTFRRAAEAAREEGGRFVSGGDVLREGDFARGYYVQPTTVDGLPRDHRLFKEELFVPFLVVAAVESLDEAIAEANASDYGLTAGIFSQDQEEIDRFFEQTETGTLYANRRGGATTGAWPGAQSFVGWKYSGTSGKGALGPYYVLQFLREQNRTVVRSSSPAAKAARQAAGE